MTDAGPVRRVRENLTSVVSTLVTGIWLVALFTGQDWWLPFMLFGYIVLVPLVALLSGDESEIREWWHDATGETSREPDASAARNGDDALATLRERYARGELTDEQFERKLEHVLETETLEEAEERRRETDTATEREF